jgi:uncharacterized protein DUF6011
VAFAPEPYLLDVDALADESMALALRSGRLVATVVSRKTGKHITIQLRAKVKAGRRFRACELAEADRIYIDVPSSAGAGAEVGALHLVGKWAGKILPPWGEDFDRARLWAARRVLDVAHGRALAVDDQAEILEGKICLMCGRDLTDPESIARNIGPDCWKRAAGAGEDTSRHQRRGEQLQVEDEDLGEGNAEDGANGIADGASAGEALDAFADQGGLAELRQFGDQVRGGRDVDAEVDELQGKVFDDAGEEVDVRAEIEAELQQTTIKPTAGEDVDDLPAAPVEVPEGLVLLRAGEDPRELLAEPQA